MSENRAARCVLTFHRIVETREQDHDVTWDSFVRVVDHVGAATAELDLEGGGRLAVLTFDDGTTDHATAGELLAERGLAGVFFVSAGKLGRPGYLDDDGVRQLAALGHEIASHGVAHVRLDSLSPGELRHELEDSRDALARLAGTEIRYFAPPGGSDHPELAAELERCGYRASRSMRWGIYSNSADRFRVPCLPVTELTVHRGWVEQGLARFVLPRAMRAVGRAKNLLPPGPHRRIRSWSHR